MAYITRVYDSYDEARRAAEAVNSLRLTDVDASLVGTESIRGYHDEYQTRVADTASGASTGAGIGATVGGGAGLLAGLGILAIPGLGPLVAVGWLAATAAGAVGGALAGGAVGALSDIGVSEEEAPVYSEAVRRGGVLVSARFPEESRIAVEQALDQFPTVHIDERRSAYEAEGWNYDETEADREARLRNAGLPPRI